ncbi:ORF12 [Aviadenovirus phalacrocoracidae]|uniref:ORF12 n=1 Tax=Aviadenovirus sp. TaxID=2217649 RepID=A0ABZ0T1H4_9ADEN|nr:ORF12 [Aviadenovirus sp.]
MRRKAMSFEELVNHLEKFRLFSVNEWKSYNRELYEKWKHSADTVIKAAKERYCSYSLYQSLLRNDPLIGPHSFSSPFGSFQLYGMAEKEGFNICVLTFQIARWLWEYTVTGIKNSINTIYVVGDGNSDAETFCRSITRIFSCVLSADINTLDMANLSKFVDQVKLIYFPSKMHELPFQNPLVNDMLRGRDMQVLTSDGPKPIPQVKCLVHLKNLPRADQLPTNRDQHVVIHFAEPGEGKIWLETELKRYIKRVLSAEDEHDFNCANPYGVICSLARSNVFCRNCGKSYLDIISVTE